MFEFDLDLELDRCLLVDRLSLAVATEEEKYEIMARGGGEVDRADILKAGACDRPAPYHL